MSVKTFVDTNTLKYAHDPDANEKGEEIIRILSAGKAEKREMQRLREPN